jgi:hypothetical protein
MKFRLASAVALFAAAVAFAQPPIVGPSAFDQNTNATFKVDLPDPAGLALDVPAGLSIIKRDKEWYVTGCPGKYRLKGDYIDFDARKRVLVDFQFEIKPTQCNGVVPQPDPGPGPQPDPTPDPSVTPIIDGPGFKALYVVDDRQLLQPNQMSVAYGKPVRQYLASKAAKGPDLLTPEVRILKAEEVEKAGQQGYPGWDEKWKKAVQRPRQPVPLWAVLSGPGGNFEGPIPATETQEQHLTRLKTIAP